MIVAVVVAVVVAVAEKQFHSRNRLGTLKSIPKEVDVIVVVVVAVVVIMIVAATAVVVVPNAFNERWIWCISFAAAVLVALTSAL